MSRHSLTGPDGHVVANVQHVRLSGAPAHGRFRLDVTFGLTPQPTETTPYPWVRSVGAELYARGVLVAHFAPSSGKPGENGWRSFKALAQPADVTLSTLLDAPTILALDRARATDGSLRLALVVLATVESADRSTIATFLRDAALADPETRAAIESFERRASFPAPWPPSLTDTSPAHATLDTILTASDWSRILGGMRWEERVLLEIPVDGHRVAGRFADAAKHMREALRQLELRQWPQTLLACREVLDALAKEVPEKAPPPSDWASKSTREAWDVAPRLALAREVVRHVTHVGAHQGKLGPVDEAQARMTLQLTAAIFAALVT